MKPAIQVNQLSKVFIMRETSPGLLGALKGLFSAKKHEVQAVQQLSFDIQPGERVAFIGPNGAGKSTTIKMLTGILYPTSGDLEVLGIVPWRDRHALGYKIGTVFGQRTQLWYHLPPSDTFALLAKIYEIDPQDYQARLHELTEVFGLAPFLSKPVRQLSLGERMRCEIVASLLHRPQILFLDEPTIGLDINAKLMIRDLLHQLSQEHGTTLFLTSHDTADIEQVCDRVIILDKGRIIQDSSIKELKKNYIKKKILTLLTSEVPSPLQLAGVKTLEQSPHHITYEVDLSLIPIDRVIQAALKMGGVKDITIEDPSMEEIIREVYGTVDHS
jgi:ABC-2 type transport system ATP-binding protein